MNYYNEKVKKYRHETKGYLNKWVEVRYGRANDINHCLTGQVIKIRKNSLVLLQEDKDKDLTINIGFRNIKEIKLI